jgi:hypothetical protein
VPAHPDPSDVPAATSGRSAVTRPPLHADGVSVVIPAFREAARIVTTIAAARDIAGVDLVVVADDGSDDDTAQRARAAGAEVSRTVANAGKASALERGAALVAQLEADAGVSGRPLLFLDADLGDSARRATALLGPVRAGSADLAIATLPAQPGGGRGFVVRLARDGIEQACGFVSRQPLSGQRAMTREAFEGARPLAAGWGIEVGMTIDVVRAGFRVVEVEVPFFHRVTGSDWRAQLHRARQYLGVWRALRARGAGPRLPIPR